MNAANSSGTNGATERAYVVGTAGHVDHGKSTLVRALTGIDPDRLAEEKAREMTIDLGFAWLTLPSGQVVSVVDVPGHERFIKNMLAGVGGIDAALLVVAADEGPMPQTREHLAILDLLGINRGVIVLTKADTVDEEFLELATEATREATAGTTLANAPLIATAATTGQGLDALKAALDALLANTPPHAPHGRPRLPVDRAFTITGFGTVVTGTLLDGTLAAGQEVELLPRGIRGRVRGVQTHQAKVPIALPGSRAAVNISGVAVEDVRRGDVLTLPGWLVPTHLLDVRLRMTASAPVLEQNDPIDLFIGASEVQGRVTLLGANRLEAGDEGWVQLRLAEPVAVVRGDRFILRRPSPSETIGGGMVVDSAPRRHRRFHAAKLERLESLKRGTPQDLARQLLANGPREVREVIAAMGLEQEAARPILAALIGEGEILVLQPAADVLSPNAFLLLESGAGAMESRMTLLLASFHTANPLKRGMPREEAKSRLGLAPRLFDAFVAHLQKNGSIVAEGGSAPVLRMPGHMVTLPPAERATADALLAALAGEPYAPPDPATFGVGPETLAVLAAEGSIVRVAEGIIFSRDAYDRMVLQTLALIDAHGSVTLAQFRDAVGTSRKYAQAVMEYLDARRITRRAGDARLRGPLAREIAPPAG
ncbi:MAG: selenocysteine-specific translation elongation factor [Chloroflexota bacterium]|nr:selenocysteine-specific translation elongation factor [Chloroflexota bacterium]